jgi:hypothetical protein
LVPRKKTAVAAPRIRGTTRSWQLAAVGPSHMIWRKLITPRNR